MPSALCCAVEVLGTNETLENYSCHFIFVEFRSVVGKPPECGDFIFIYLFRFCFILTCWGRLPIPFEWSFSFCSTYVYLCVSSSECGMTYNVVWSNECSC